ncbi:extracellular solute-binding protein [Paenibacillus sp. YN15]|uniref:extracellular solute-binding protein n=1 Tax=Paenibacillus sp. YN15 TaxID=1742774 RepID=UPI000DCDC475|nr:extracellular solute-binding protein [Paenibacillus sp. YN15]RAU93561.1 ABC transporter substrate-binding protein [Paenibacillus sp. YN15]
MKLILNKRVWIPALAVLLVAALAAAIAASLIRKPADGTAPSDNAVRQISIMLPLHQSTPPPDSLIREIQTRTGYKLDIKWIPDEVYSNRLMNNLESKETSQAVFVKPTDLTAIKNAIRSDMFWNIGPYLDHYPNLRALERFSAKLMTIDGKIYGLYNERPESRQGVIIRKDWLNALGLTEPKTLDELYRVLKAFTEQDPDGNGKADTVGLTDRNDLYYGAFKTLSSYFGTPNGWALSDGKLTPEFATPEYMNTMNYMKKLYTEQLVNTDFPVTSKAVQRYRMITGKAGVYIGSLADAPRLLEETRQVNPQADFAVLNRIEGPKGYGIWSMSGNGGMFFFSKKNLRTEQQLRDVLAFFDRTMDPDISNLLFYGIENIHYILKDGKVSYKDNAMYSLAGTEVLPLSSLLVSSVTNPHLYKRNPEGTDPLLVEVNRLIDDNATMLIQNPTVGLSSNTYDARNVELDFIINNATYNFILGKIDEAGFREEVNNWMEKGGAAVIQELEEALRTGKP